MEWICDHIMALVHRRGKWHNNIGPKLGFYWQMTHVAFATDVVHLHNIEQYKSSPL